MKEKSKTRPFRKTRRELGLDFVPRNYQLFSLGLLVLVLGFAFMTIGPVDSFWSLTLAPILLVISYCIIIPTAILYRPKQTAPKDANVVRETVAK